jgi:hypothetical protein
MTEQDASTEARTEALRNVVDRVTSYEESAPEGTIRTELDSALDEVGIDLSDAQRERVTQQISDGQDVDVEALAAEGS